jgi:exopolyphosphatase/guanosine-5'-triphosphate,3'-diphosphate pyrophosphatase
VVETLGALPTPPVGAQVVGVAGTLTTLFAVQNSVEPYESARVHGGKLGLEELRILTERLFRLPVAQRRALPGLQPKRADVIPLGALILVAALEQLGAQECGVSDRGLRWGLIAARAGA